MLQDPDSRHSYRIQGDDLRKASKIAHLEREHVPDAIRFHGSDKARIMDLCTPDLMRDNQPPPVPKDIRGIGQKREEHFDPGGQSVRGANRISKSVDIGGPGADVPELGDILRCDAKLIAFGIQRFQRLARRLH